MNYPPIRSQVHNLNGWVISAALAEKMEGVRISFPELKANVFFPSGKRKNGCKKREI